MVTRGSSLRAFSRRSTVFSVLFAAFFVALGVLAVGCSLDDGRAVFVAPESHGDGGPAVIEGGPIMADVAALDGGVDDAGDGGSAPSTGNVTAGGTYTAPATPGTYTVVATSHADPGARGTATLAVVAAPVATITAPAIASANAIGLAASVVAQSGATFAWTVTGGAITAGDGTNAVTFTAGASGVVTLGVAVTNAAGDSASASANVVISDPPSTPTITAPSKATTGATGLVATITPQSGASYAWSISGGTITTVQNSPTVVFTAGAVGTLTLGVTVTNVAGTATGSASVDVVAAPVVSITAPASAIAGASGLIASVPDQTGATYAWTISGGTISGSTTSHSVTFTAGAAGTLVLGCTVTSSAGTSTTGSRNVSVVAGASLAVTLVGAPSNASVSVSGPDGYVQTVTATLTLSGLAAGPYTVGAGPVVDDGFTYTPAVTGSPLTLAAGDSGSVTVTYTKTNTAPTIGAIAGQTLAAGGAAVVVPFTVGDEPLHHAEPWTDRRDG